MNNDFFHSKYIVEWTAATGKICYGPDWPGDPDGELYTGECAGLRDPGRTLRAYGTTEERGAGFDLYPDFLAPFNVTSTNLLIALRDAIRIDLGDLDPSSNIYLNKTYFDEIIEVDPYPAAVAPLLINADLPWRISYDTYWPSCTPWGCTNGTWAETLKNLPPDTPHESIMLPYRPTTPTSSVLNLSYLCPTIRRKPTASLLMSVFVSTVTMYNFLYGIFNFIMPKVEACYRRRRAGNKGWSSSDHEKQPDSEKSKYDYHISPSSESDDGSPSIKRWQSRRRFMLRETLHDSNSTRTPKSVIRYSV
ncbi:hypothetical protein B0J17DRAFT_685118 [Rhizoctonia solani]|nr:hypothetical protein B0J17DRAFT_685118 [Rhizoctonia solani]